MLFEYFSRLSLQQQSIAWKVFAPKGSSMCRVGRQPLLTHSLNPSDFTSCS